MVSSGVNVFSFSDAAGQKLPVEGERYLGSGAVKTWSASYLIDKIRLRVFATGISVDDLMLAVRNAAYSIQWRFC